MTTEQQKELIEHIKNKICAREEDKYRTWMQTIFADFGYHYATNGYILIRTNYPFSIEVEASKNRERASKINEIIEIAFDKTKEYWVFNVKESISCIEENAVYKNVYDTTVKACSKCAGTGETHCSHCGQDTECDECDGTGEETVTTDTVIGKEINPDACYVRFVSEKIEELFNPDYVHRILRAFDLAGVETIRLRITHTEAIFESEKITGIVMARRYSDEYFDDDLQKAVPKKIIVLPEEK